MTGEPMTTARAVVLGPGEGATMPNPTAGTMTFKTTAAETSGTLTVFETVIAAGLGPPLHVHVDMDEVIYVLDGMFRMQLGADLH